MGPLGYEPNTTGRGKQYIAEFMMLEGGGEFEFWQGVGYPNAACSLYKSLVEQYA